MVYRSGAFRVLVDANTVERMQLAPVAGGALAIGAAEGVSQESSSLARWPLLACLVARHWHERDLPRAARLWERVVLGARP